MKTTRATKVDPAASAGWTFLTNHAHVLLCLAEQPDARMRIVAARVGITERAVQRIVAELEEAGYLDRVRDGRVNRYLVHAHLFLRHPIENHCTIGHLIKMVIGRRAVPGSRVNSRRRRDHKLPPRRA